MPSPLVRLLLAAAVLAALAPAAAAQTWRENVNGAWSDPNRWTPAGVPVGGATTVLTFPNVSDDGYTSFNDIAGSFPLNEIVFDNAGRGLIQLDIPFGTSNKIQFVTNAGVGPFATIAGPGFSTTRAPINLAATTTVRGTGPGVLELRGIVDGPGGLAVNAAPGGWVSLNGNHTFTGGVTLDAGNLVLFHDNGLGAAANVLTANGGTLVLGTTTAQTRTVGNNITANATLVVKSMSQTGQILNGSISGTGGLSYDGFLVGSSVTPVSTLSLGGANSFTGPTTLRRGNITLFGASGALTGTSGVTAFGTTLTLVNNATNNNDRLADAAQVTLHAGTLDLVGSGTAGGTHEVVGAVTGTGHAGLGLFGPTTQPQALTAASFARGTDRSTWSFVGNLLGQGTGTSGAIKIGAGPEADLVGGGGPAGTPTVSILPYAASPTPGGSAATPVTYTAAGGVRVLAPAELAPSLVTLSGQATTQNVRSLFGGAEMILGNTAVNSLTGTSPSGQGTLTVTSGLVLNSAVATGGLDFGSREGVILSSNTFAPIEILAPVAGSNGVTVAALTRDAAVVFTRDNPFTGPLTVNRGRLEFSADAQLGSAASPVALNGGGLRYTGFGGTVPRTVTLGPAFSAGPLDPTNGAVGVTGQTTTLTLSGAISGPGGLVTRDDPGVIALTNAGNTYTGNTLINGRAKLHVGSDGALGNGGPIILTNGLNSGWLGITGSFTTARPIFLALDQFGLGGSILNAGRIMTEADLTVAGTIADYTPGVTAALQKLGPADLILTGAATFKGATAVSAGRVVVRDGGSLATNNSAMLAPGATLRLDNATANDNNRFSGEVQFTGGTLELVGHAGGTFETVGDLRFFSFGSSTVRLVPAANATASLTTSGVFTGQGAMVLFSGTSLGVAVPTTTRLFVGGATNNLRFGRFSQAFGFDGTNYGMVTYDVTGVRLLNTNGATGEYVETWAGGGAQSNVRVSAAATTGTKTVNSAVFNAGGGLTINAGATVTIDSGDILALPGNTGVSGGSIRAGTDNVMKIYTAGDFTLGAAVTSTGTLNLSKAGSGVLTLSGANTVANYSFHEGTVRLGAAGTLPTTANVFLGPGAVLDLNGFSPTITQLLSTNGEFGTQPSTVQLGTARLTVTHTSGTNASFNGNFTGTTGGFTLEIPDVGGDYRFGGRFDTAGDTVIRSGRVYLTKQQGPGGPFVLGDAASTIPVSLFLNGYFNFAGSDITSLDRPVVIQANAAQAATLGVASVGAVGSSVTLGGDVTLNANPLALRVDANSRFRQTGVISGPGRVEPTGGGVLVLAGNNAQLGGTRFVGTPPVVEVESDAAFGGGPLELSAATATVRVLTGPRTFANPVTGGGTLNLTAAHDVTFAGPVTTTGLILNVVGPGVVTAANTISGTGVLTKSGGGTLVLPGANTFSGGFTLSGGLVVLGSDSGAGTGPLGTGTLTTNGPSPGKGFRAQGADRTLANPVTLGGDFFLDGPLDLTFTGAVTAFSTTAVNVRDPVGVVTFAGQIGNTGSGGLTKLGPGLVRLANPTGNTYSGPTTVSDGTLRVENTSGSGLLNSGVTVNGTGTLDGTGSVGRLVTLGPGGTLRGGVGGPAETITLTAGLKLDGTNTFRVAVGDANLGNGTADPTAGLIDLAGTALTQDAAGTHLTTIKLSAPVLGLDYGQQYTITVATFGSTSNLVLTDFTIDMNPEGFFFAGTPFATLGPTNLTVTFTPLPEPSAVLGLAAGLAGYAAARRRSARTA